MTVKEISEAVRRSRKVVVIFLKDPDAYGKKKARDDLVKSLKYRKERFYESPQTALCPPG
jgi:hypothetical protein